MDLSYIIDKINEAEFSSLPFKHVEIFDLFKQSDFEEIITTPQIATPAVHSDLELFEVLFANNYRIISFPGSTLDYLDYIDWHKEKKITHRTKNTCQSYGVTLRLESSNSTVINSLQDLINAPEFINCLAKKFNIETTGCDYDTGIQKYLDGYEISPHPDIRKKALTFLININPSPNSFSENYHTSYLRLKPEWEYIVEFWKGNKNYDRCWVPWEWCEVIKQQRNNNSIVIFAPDNNTIHAVKADYNHLINQRTQLYGNFWYRNVGRLAKPEWEDLLIQAKLKEIVHPDPRETDFTTHSLRHFRQL